MTMNSKMNFSRKTDELENVFQFLQQKENEYGCSDRQKMEIDLCVEEVFMNMVRHNSSMDNKIEISVDKKGENKIIICLIDHEENPFDITKTDDLDLEDYVEKKKSGGLGIHLIKQLMDEISFEHQRGISKITMVKYI
ncbi:MAG: ATP-binding protein [Balneolaceae bacterium]|nr:MAG: ATP-binding protein [Balneolaceae bacterium]